MDKTPSDDLRRLAARYESETTPARADQLAARALDRARAGSSRVGRWALVGAGAAAAAAGVVAVALVYGGPTTGPAASAPLAVTTSTAATTPSTVVPVDTINTEDRLAAALSLVERGETSAAARVVVEAIQALPDDPGFLALAPSVEEVVASVATAPPPGSSGSETTVAGTDTTAPQLTLELAISALIQSVENAKAAAAANDPAALDAATARLEQTLADAIVAAAAVDPASTTTLPTGDEGGATTTTEATPASTSTAPTETTVPPTSTTAPRPPETTTTTGFTLPPQA